MKITSLCFFFALLFTSFLIYNLTGYKVGEKIKIKSELKSNPEEIKKEFLRLAELTYDHWADTEESSSGYMRIQEIHEAAVDNLSEEELYKEVLKEIPPDSSYLLFAFLSSCFLINFFVFLYLESDFREKRKEYIAEKRSLEIKNLKKENKEVLAAIQAFKKHYNNS